MLKNTLSDNGGVTRGICKMDENGNLTEVVETKNIVKTADGAEADGVAVDVNSLVSMNMWGLTSDFLTMLEKGFKEFFEKEVPGNPLKAEYLIPIFIGELLEQGKMFVKVLKTNDTWYGMTYHEDVAAVKDSFKKMLENGVYKAVHVKVVDKCVDDSHNAVSGNERIQRTGHQLVTILGGKIRYKTEPTFRAVSCLYYTIIEEKCHTKSNGKGSFRTVWGRCKSTGFYRQKDKFHGFYEENVHNIIN